MLPLAIVVAGLFVFWGLALVQGALLIVAGNMKPQDEVFTAPPLSSLVTMQQAAWDAQAWNASSAANITPYEPRPR